MQLNVRKVGLVVALAATALAFGRSLGRATVVLGPVADVSAVRSDLDTYDDARLMRDLRDELNDVLEQVEDDDADLETLAELILDAFGDDGDTGAETDISLEDLEAEMAEAGTSLEAVIAGALGMGVSDAGGSVSTHTVPMIIRASREVGVEMQSDHPRTRPLLERVAVRARNTVRQAKSALASGTSGV